MAKKKKDQEVSDDPERIVKELENFGSFVINNSDGLKPEYFLSTGLFSLDRAICEFEGIPGNCCILVHGQFATGKTSLSLNIIAQAQKEGMETYYVDAEHAINPSVIKCFSGLNADKVNWVYPDNAESALDIMKYLLKTRKKILIINDSITACIPKADMDGSAGDATVAEQARLFSKFMPTARKYCRTNNNILLQLTQERAKIGQKTKELSGGAAPKYYSDIIIDLRKKWPKGEIVSGTDKIGHMVIANIEKTRWGSPFQTATLPIIYGMGFDIGRELFECGLLFDIVEQKGAWYNIYDNEEEDPIYTGQGAMDIAKHIRENPNIQEMFKKKIRDILS